MTPTARLDRLERQIAAEIALRKLDEAFEQSKPDGDQA